MRYRVTVPPAAWVRTPLRQDDQREGNPGSVHIAFTLTGRYTAKDTLRVVIRGKVTAALPIAADCADVKFTEVHVLKHIKF